MSCCFTYTDDNVRKWSYSPLLNILLKSRSFPTKADMTFLAVIKFQTITLQLYIDIIKYNIHVCQISSIIFGFDKVNIFVFKEVQYRVIKLEKTIQTISFL
ncbi:hypothetical protein RF11_09665 [Thelohanellus kitauei]|uniref:Uncharacterized protein n=1 Tax=Thelohanellus kitauei TaxID=669202 RepID=A0A0C2MN41_THEKT|nr:hypothetical protein RF11_09665 [Thelohanellus kitauei]